VAAGAPPALGPAQARYDEQLTAHREEILHLRVALERQRADAMAEKVVQSQLESRPNAVEWDLGDTRDQLKQLAADYKALLGCLDRFGVAIPRKRSRTDGANEGDQRTTEDAYASYVEARAYTRCPYGATRGTDQCTLAAACYYPHW
jgi:hypothetical protein